MRSVILRLAAAVLLIGGITGASTSPASAATKGHGYLGVGAGISSPTVDEGSAHFDTEDWNPSVAPLKLYSGYMVNAQFGLETGYLLLGKAKVSTMGGGSWYQAKVTALEVAPVISFPAARALAIYARPGVVLWRSTITYRLEGRGDGKDSESGAALAASAGLQYRIGTRIAVRGEYSYYGIDKEKAGVGGYGIGSAGVGVVF